MPSRKPKIDVESLLARLENEFGRPRMIARFDPIEELVSCIMSQHTSDANSFPTFTRLRETFTDWQDIVGAGADRIADTIRHAGLANQKSKNIVESLKRIKSEFGDYTLEPLRSMTLVGARDWLVQLPGVGPKTASIVLCFSFGMGAIPVDTHIFRVSWRLGLIDESIGESKSHDALLKLVPPKDAFRFHVLLIQQGRIVCRAPLPECTKCVVQDLCPWHAKGGPEKRRTELAKNRLKAKEKSAKRAVGRRLS